MAIISGFNTTDELTKITSTTSGTINNQVIKLAKKVLFTKISAYIIDDDELEIIRNKISNMKIELLSGDSFKSYTQDFKYIIQLFMILTNLDVNDLFRLYISKDEWLTDEIISTFNPNDNELVGLVVEYDNRLNPNKYKTFNPNNVLQFLFNSIKIKINNSEKLDTEKLEEFLKQYYGYYYDVDRDLEASTKTNMAEILDILGTYKHKISR